MQGRRCIWYLTIALLVWAARPYAAEPQMAAHCINVGQADATLLEFPCGAVLIDAGAQDDAAANHLMQYLSTFFQRRRDLSNTLSTIFITHPHKDHTFALRRVVQSYSVGHFVESGQDYGSGIANVKWVRSVASQKHIEIKPVLNSEVMRNGNKSGLTDRHFDSLRCPNCDPEIVVFSGQWDEDPGWSKSEYRNNNDHSLVIRVEFGDSSFLFPGDLEEDGIKSLLAYYSNTLDFNEVAKIIVWSFLAGFAERLVPDRLEQLAHNGSPSSSTAGGSEKPVDRQG